MIDNAKIRFFVYLTTETNGDISQRIEYTPFGEVFVEERNNTWNTPFLFNAKELDEETGLYYYGARYYDPRTSLWLSVDPLAEKYPGMSPYNYCANNPVKLIDPDGREIVLKTMENPEENETLENFKSNYPDDEAIYIIAHGHKGFMQNPVDGEKIADAESFSKYLSEHSETWKNKKEGDEITVVLFSCSTGADDKNGNNLAKTIAEDLGITVIAPTEKAELRSDGNASVKNGGEWAVFLGNNKYVNETNRSGTWQPSYMPSLYKLEEKLFRQGLLQQGTVQSTHVNPIDNLRIDIPQIEIK